MLMRTPTSAKIYIHMDIEEKLEKPIKPKLEEFDLDNKKVNILIDFKTDCEKKSNFYLFITFGLLSIIGIFIIIITQTKYGFIILVLIATSITTWGIIPSIFKSIFNYEIKE